MKQYLQTTPFTTAPSALLILLHHYNPKIKLNRENEFKIWGESVNLPTRASSIYGLALCAKKNGLKCKVIVENKEYDFPDYRFYRYTKEDVENAFYCSKLYYQSALNNDVEIEEKKIIFNEIKQLLKKHHLMLRINTKPIRKEKRNSSNYIVVFDYKDNMFSIIDPKCGELSIPEPTFKEAFETLETKKYRDHRMIIFPKQQQTL